MLQYRYVAVLPAMHGYTTTWIGYETVDGHLQEVALDYDHSAPRVFAIPALLCQTSAS